MAVTATLQPSQERAKRWTVVFALDGDITATIPHGFNGPPDNVYLVPLNAAAYVGQVFRASVDATNIVLTKNAVVGSGGASVELIAYKPYSSL